MPSANYYRTEAERCRRLAAEDQLSSASGRLRKLAEEYEQLALCFDDSNRAAAGTTSPNRRAH